MHRQARAMLRRKIGRSRDENVCFGSKADISIWISGMSLVAFRLHFVAAILDRAGAGPNQVLERRTGPHAIPGAHTQTARVIVLDLQPDRYERASGSKKARKS